METIIVSDTSCLIILEKIGHLSLLQASYGKVVVTPTVATEFGQHLPEWVTTIEPLNTAFQKLLEETKKAAPSAENGSTAH